MDSCTKKKERLVTKTHRFRSDPPFAEEVDCLFLSEIN